MKTYGLETRLWLPHDRATIFDFFSNPHNLDRLTPPWLKFRVLSPITVEMRQGTRLDYQLRIHGMPIRWQSEISAWDPPNYFVDRQIKGPYSLWLHEHRFVEEHGGTWVEDRVEYAAFGGRLVQRYLIGPDLDRIFQYRHKALEELFSVAGSSTAAL